MDFPDRLARRQQPTRVYQIPKEMHIYIQYIYNLDSVNRSRRPMRPDLFGLSVQRKMEFFETYLHVLWVFKCTNVIIDET